MGDKRNYAALDWVLGEIGETLKDARQALEAYVEDPRDTARIRFCLTHIHQVHGSLQMVEFHGASLFAEEMELLAAALMHNKVSNDKEAQEVLMRSLLQLPLYLEQVKSTHDDHPAIVMPLLNDLRAVRKQAYLSETNLFHPDLSSVGRLTGQRHNILADIPKLKPVMKKLLDMYQFAAASVLRGIKIDDNLEYIHKVFVRLETMTRGTLCHPTWYVSSALAEALTRDDIELSVAVRGLLRQLARELKTLHEHCPAAFDAPPPEPLLRNLLYYVGLSRNGGSRVASVKQRFQLEQAIFGASSQDGSGKGLLSTPEPEAVRAVVAALQEELNSAKFLMDRALSGQGGLSEIEETLPFIKRISDTLAVLGIADMRKHTLEQYNSLVSMCKTGNVSDSVLIDVAGRLADLENRLEAIGKGRQIDYTHVDERAVEIDTAKQAVLNECRNGMDTVKEAIIESMSAKWDPSYLPRAVETLHDIRGGFNIVPLPRPAAILDACSAYIQRELLERDTTPGEALQTLAEAIASVDYYLERLAGGHGDDLDSYLEMAEESLTELGYRPSGVDAYTRVADRPVPDAQAVPPQRKADAEPPHSWEDADSYVAADESSPEEAADAVADTSDTLAVPESTLAQQATQPVSPVADEVEPVMDLEGEDLASTGVAEVSHLAETATDEPDAEDLDMDLSQPSTVSVDDDETEESAIDDEIIEIFIEEAAEVQETLAENLPRWRENSNDREALTTVRRSFHTLKGSGRMVEAMDVGELAWSVENMLNRIMDGTINVQPAHHELIEKVLLVVPALIEAFAQRQPNPEKSLTERYIEWAGRLARGEVPAELGGAPAAADTQAAQDDTDENEDQILWEIFASEATTHLDVVRGFIETTEEHSPLYVVPSDDLQRALHTLKGSAHMAAVTPIATLIAPLENFVKELRTYQVRVNDDILQLIRDAVQYTQEGLDSIERNETVELPKLDQFIARVRELRDVHVTPLIHLRDQEREGEKPVDPRLLAIFMAEEMNFLLNAHKIMADWQARPYELHPDINPLIAELQTLGEGASQANLPGMSHLSKQLRTLHAGALAGQLAVNDNLFAVLNPAHDSLLDMVDAVAAGQNIPLVSEPLQVRIDQLLETLPAGAGAVGVSPEPATDDHEAQGPDDGESELELSSEAIAGTDGEYEADTAPGEESDSGAVEATELEGADAQSVNDESWRDADDEYGIDLLADGDAYRDLELPAFAEPESSNEAFAIESAEEIPSVGEEAIDLGIAADDEFDLSLHAEDDDAIELGSFDAESETIEFAADDVAGDEAVGPAVTIDDQDAVGPVSSGEYGFELIDEDDGEVIDFSAIAFDSDEEIDLASPAMPDTTPEEESLEPESVDIAGDAVEDDLDSDLDTIAYDSIESSDFDEELSLEEDTPESEDAESDGLSIEDLDGMSIDSDSGSDEEELIEQGEGWLGGMDTESEVETTFEFDDSDIDDELRFEESDLVRDPTEIDERHSDSETAVDALAEQDDDLEDFREGWPSEPEADSLHASTGNEVEEEAPMEAHDDLLSGEEIEDAEAETAFDELHFESESESESESDEGASVADPGDEESLSEFDELQFASESDQDDTLSELDEEQPEVGEHASDSAAYPVETTERDEEPDSLVTAPMMGSYEREREAAAKDDRPISEPALTPWQLGGAASLADIETDDYDQDILEIFLEEANELIEELDESIHAWESNLAALDAPETMKRALHTLKGGARLSGLKNLGELTHNYESYLIATGHPNNDPEFFATIHQYQDVLLSGVRAVRARLDGEPIPEEPVRAASTPSAPTPKFSRDEGQVVPFAPRSPAKNTEFEPFPEKAPTTAPEPQVPQQRQGSQEMVKVSADLLEELVNLAGETTISRGRLEQQVSDLTSAVDEVDTTLGRLNEQLRRLDMETEAQVLFRQERMASYEEFDPLEMDRYSQLQQLTRSLMESASDLMDLKRTLGDKLRDTETLLLQQSRITSSLQEGLMRSRMVPFSRLVPRLRRIVRQVAAELGKQVNLEFDNVEGEMDRSVLERMVAPLEHMLRNAVDHGVEKPEDRVGAGKPASGRILLSLAREGGDILLRLADDGRGINIARVRELAVERGMMTEDSDLADYDVMQFILQAGFSTAENITQISGRGVGMDVVASEIKQLGGSMGIDSRPGVGTQFTVRLPFTVSVNRALMVQLGAETYAIPLNSIEGIVRVSPFELEHYYTQPDARFEYAGDSFQVRHLNAMITPGFLPRLEGQILPLPVILVRSGQHTMALQVDGLMGSREIVVKSLGPQFSAVQGLSGATVMGDGSVVVILDVHALVRREMALLGSGRSTLGVAHAADQTPVQTLKTIMVVDDSVTVRKVTTRFLEREGFNVITAKDGVDALQVLQEQIPDLMLLDIEMPRMDGFEVARNIRSTSRWKHIPIIMITSRTGDKHRQHALSIGVNEYLGKPYQEEVLNRLINSLLAKKTMSA